MSYQAILGTLDLTGVDEFGVQWTVDPDSKGWSGSPASTISPVQKPRQNGVWAGDAYLRARHISVSGLILAPTQADLVAAFARLDSAVTLASTSYTVTEAGVTLSQYVRREDEVIADYVTDVIGAYSIQLLATDARKFSTPLVGSTAEFAVSGGLTVPFTLPVSIGSTISSGLITLTNTGTKPGPVVARIDGPVRGPIITHVGPSGVARVFSLTGLELSAGEWLDIDMERRTVYANGTASRSGYVTSRAWSTFEVGLNTWSFSAVLYDAAALLTITATPAS